MSVSAIARLTASLAVALAWAPMCQARDWVVEPGGPLTIQAAVDQAMPGDRVVVRPGRYPGQVVLKRSGTEAAPITIIADPAREALLDGSEPLTGWKPCASADECGGNPHFASIHTLMLPAGVTAVSANLYEGEKLLHLSQTPEPRDPFYFDDRERLRPIPQAGYSSTQIVDPDFFNQPDADHWDGAIVLVWTGNNAIIIRPIRSYDPATGTVTFDKTVSRIHPGKDGYAVRNHPAIIDGPGQYAVGPADAAGRRRVWLWPHDPASLEGRITVSVRTFGFNLNGQSHVRIEGFRIRRYSGELGQYTDGVGIINANYQPASGAVIRNNEILQCKAGTGRWALQTIGYSDSVIEDNDVHHNQINRGIGATGSKSAHIRNVTIRNNQVQRNGGTGINFYYAQASRIVGNTVRDNRGNHANGITCYLDSSDILIDRNRVFRSNMGITVQSSSNITITNNLIVGQDGFTGRLITLYGRGENITVVNNTVLNAEKNNAISVPNDAANYVVRNNIADGIAMPTREAPGPIVLTNNVYTDLTWNMEPAEMGEGGILERNLRKIFTDPEDEDFTLRRGSPAIDAGADVSQVTDHDLTGAARPQGRAFDAGAYEYANP